MNYYWIQDRTNLQQFHIYWIPGKGNLGDYHTKHFSPAHHKQVRSVYLHQPKQCELKFRKGVINTGSLHT